MDFRECHAFERKLIRNFSSILSVKNLSIPRFDRRNDERCVIDEFNEFVLKSQLKKYFYWNETFGLAADFKLV